MVDWEKNMRKNRLTITCLATCVIFSLMAGCHRYGDDGWASDSPEQATLTSPMRGVIESTFWREAPTEAEVERLVDAIVSQSSDSIIFLGADRKFHSIGPGLAERYRTAKVQTGNFPEGIDSRFIRIDLRDHPGHSRARILQVLPALLAEQGTDSRQDSWQSEPAAGEYEYTLLFDRHRMEAYEVDLGDIRGALSEYEIVRVDPENSEGILLEIAIEEDQAADPRALMDSILVEPDGNPVRLRDVGVFRVIKAASAR